MSQVVEVLKAPPQLTTQQAEALEVSGASVALSAGAGCGKTRVLTERFLRYLEAPERRPLRSLVALTFTEKAARELRNRVRQACRDRLGQGEEPAYWRSVLRGLEAAPIGTFHGFCGELLRRYPIEAKVEPGYRVLEESIAPSVRDDALARLTRRWLAEQNEDLAMLAVEHGLSTVRNAITDLVADRGGSDYARWAEREPAEVVEEWERFWEEEARPRLVARVLPFARDVLDLLARFDTSHPKMRGRVAFLREQLPSLATLVRPEELLREIVEQAKVQHAGNANHWSSPEAYEQIKGSLTELREEAKKCVEALTLDPAASALAAEHGIRFARLAAEAVEAFERAKRAEGLLDFDDLIVKARNLLRDGPDSVRDRLRDEFQVILVDEFQDTDPLQDEILNLLTGEQNDRGRLFLVGDSKQSIYGFRGARPDLFDQQRTRFPEQGRKDLTENFRSAPGIIDFINALFCDHFMGEEHRLVARSAHYAKHDGTAVEFVWATDPSQREEDGKPNAAARRKVEARWLARHLKARLDAGWPICDETTHKTRNANAGDVVFLFRALSDSASYENALIEVGLDYYLVGGSAFFAQQEVLDLINTLTVIEDPTDELALAGALRSPFFGISDAGLYWLVHEGSSDLTEGLERSGQAPHLSATDRERATRARRLLEGWRAAKDRVPIAALLDRALDESGYEAALLGEHLGERKRANCRKLVRMARAFDAEGRFTLADFVARLRADLRKPPREEQAATTEEQGDAIRLMSIHQAKGLEFPIVVVPDLDRKAPPPRGRVAFHERLGLVVRPPDDREDGTEGDGLGWACYKEVERHEEDAEAYRLLYVAATRAREALILSAGMTADDPPKSPALRLLASRFDRASGACLAALPDGLRSPKVAVRLEPPPPPATSGRRKRPDLIKTAEVIEQARLASPDEPKSPPPRRHRIELDPKLGLSVALAPVDGLVRAILDDPDGLDLARLDVVADRVGRTLRPDRVELAKAMIRGWLKDGPPKLAIPKGDRLRALPWVHAWPPDAQPPTILTGRLDLASRVADGRWTLFGVSLPGADESAERLRLILSARAAGLGPDVQGWLVRLDPERPASWTAQERFDDAAIEDLIDRVGRAGL